MSTQSVSLPLNPFHVLHGEDPGQLPVQPQKRSVPEQSRALEALGHAIEYLVDSRLFDQWESAADAEAVHLLMACSVAIYTGEQANAPWHERVQRNLLKKLNLRSNG